MQPHKMFASQQRGLPAVLLLLQLVCCYLGITALLLLLDYIRNLIIQLLVLILKHEEDSSKSIAIAV